MVSNRMTEGVGKRIVDALKQQSDIEFQSNEETLVNNDNEDTNEILSDDFNTVNNNDEFNFENTQQPNFVSSANISFDNHLTQKNDFANELDDFEIPTNVAVLKQLINKLPSGVSKQTGAQIIKQTMEALGISMKSVLQEAQQVQDSLNNSSRECQSSIVEYKKQITMLERQSQKLQRQYAALNDIISLFIQNV